MCFVTKLVQIPRFAWLKRQLSACHFNNMFTKIARLRKEPLGLPLLTALSV